MALDLFAILGGKELLVAFVQIKRKAAGVAQSNLFGKAEDVMTAAKRLAPKDTGFMATTGFVRRVGKDIVELGFGTDYALFVHEIPPPEEGAPHPDQIEPGTRTARHKAPTQWKFLQRPAQEAFGSISIAFKGRGSVFHNIKLPRF